MSLTTLHKVPRVKCLALLVLVACLLGSAGCSKELSVAAPGREFSDSSTLVGSGVMGSTTVAVSGFSGVRLQSVGTVRLQQGSAETLRIEAEDNLLDVFTAQVRGGVLEISTLPGVGFRSSLPITFYVSGRDVENLAVEGVGEITAVGLNANTLSLEMSGPGAINLSDLRALRLEASLTGPGSVKISGQVDRQKVSNFGPGEFDARALRSAEAAVDLSGTGNVTVRVLRSLRARVSGLGSVYYIGDPEIDSKITGMGGVVQIGG